MICLRLLKHSPIRILSTLHRPSRGLAHQPQHSRGTTLKTRPRKGKIDPTEKMLLYLMTWDQPRVFAAAAVGGNLTAATLIAMLALCESHILNPVNLENKLDDLKANKTVYYYNIGTLNTNQALFLLSFHIVVGLSGC